MHEVIKKAFATVEPVESENPNGEFDVILSAQTKDRDGEILKSDEWKTPLPEHVTFDVDHGMSVATTVGSGRPFINDDGDLQVRGSFASTPLGQETRTLVNEGHIRTTSVAFMTSKTKKDTKPERELLNGAFVAVPSNREAVVLSSKSLWGTGDVSQYPHIPASALEKLLPQQLLFGRKVGARNSTNDASMIQAIHDAAYQLGALCADGGEEMAVDGTKSLTVEHETSGLEAGSPQESAEESADESAAAAQAAAADESADESADDVAAARATELGLSISATALDAPDSESEQ